MFTQPLERVAIVGASGRIGGAFTKSLLETGKHTVTALTRVGSASKLPEGAKRIEVDYDDESSLVAALAGQQFLVIAVGVAARDTLHGKITAAAGKAGVPYVMPNAFGSPQPENPNPDDRYTQIIAERVQDVRDNGVSTPVVLSCGCWYEWSLALGEEWFGFTIKDRKVTFIDDGKRVLTVSTWDQCGRALAALLSLPEAGASPSLADFKGEGKGVRMSSWRVSQRDVLDSLHRVLGTTDADWEITYEECAKRVKDGAAALQQGDRKGFAKMLYGHLFDKSNETSGYVGVANEVLGLPKEDLDEATRRAVEMVESGWKP
ncbi:hypothetical protein C8A01DRAFT_37455 [Parachaetomium inaequale]|uniref:NAD(P)-binding domain-containing protein n=1 Tax=Parachaetomium inaequale TaxID=2588326 RepID=A0AAN6SQP6_9PEZI|nr:hypothetical protein C8A01DRAFT_37455 [Parachaetomium inaequale]